MKGPGARSSVDVSPRFHSGFRSGLGAKGPVTDHSWAEGPTFFPQWLPRWCLCPTTAVTWKAELHPVTLEPRLPCITDLTLFSSPTSAYLPLRRFITGDIFPWYIGIPYSYIRHDPP